MKTIINLATVDGLKSLGDPTLFNRLVDLFTETGLQQIQNICQFAESTDWAKVSSEAHSLKSSAVSLGADELGDMCLTLEDKAADQDQKKSLVLRLREEFEKAVVELKKLKDSE